MSMTTLISKLFPLFVTNDKRVNTSSRHLIITQWAIYIITARAIVTLILKGWRRWRGSHSETTHNSLSSCNSTNMGVHLTQLITKSVKVSIHAHKLCHDGLKSHPPTKDKGAEVDGAVEAGGVAVSVEGCLERSCAILRLTVAASMAHMNVKWGDLG